MGKIDTIKFHRGKGCQKCRETGYRGRSGLYEVMEMTARIQESIVHKVADSSLRKIAREEGMRTLREDGVAKVEAGITTIEEVLRVTKLI